MQGQKQKGHELRNSGLELIDVREPLNNYTAKDTTSWHNYYGNSYTGTINIIQRKSHVMYRRMKLIQNNSVEPQHEKPGKGDSPRKKQSEKRFMYTSTTYQSQQYIIIIPKKMDLKFYYSYRKSAPKKQKNN